MKLLDYLKEAQNLEENASQNRKKSALKLFSLLGISDSSLVEQHHLDGDETNNDPLNFVYLYSKDGKLQKNAHRYIHAKAYVDRYSCEDVYLLIPDYENNTSIKKKLTKRRLDEIASKIKFQKSTEIKPEDYGETIK